MYYGHINYCVYCMGCVDLYAMLMHINLELIRRETSEIANLT